VKSLDISEVEALLNSLRLLGLAVPQHIFILSEPITAEVDGRMFFRGLAPAWGNAIVLGSQADATTPFHELAHNLGFGEFAANIFGKILALKYNVTRGLPLSELKFREVRYREVDDLPVEFKNRVKHYILVK
jgi:hypothetical protein